MLRTLSFLALAGITACGSTSGGQFVPSDDQTRSSFAPGLAFGGTASSTNPVFRSGGDINSSLQGYGYEVGGGLGGGVSGSAGLLPNTTVSAPAGSGVATYRGDFEMASTEIVDRAADGELTVQTRQFSGQLNLIANFNTNRLTGSNDTISVSGDIAGSDLSGTVTHNGIAGELDGLIGSDATIGAFHGNDNDIVFAGGFIASQPQ